MNETVDGQYQKYTVASGDYIRQDFFGADARLLDMVRTTPTTSSASSGAEATTRKKCTPPTRPRCSIAAPRR